MLTSKSLKKWELLISVFQNQRKRIQAQANTTRKEHSESKHQPKIQGHSDGRNQEFPAGLEKAQHEEKDHLKIVSKFMFDIDMFSDLEEALMEVKKRNMKDFDI